MANDLKKRVFLKPPQPLLPPWRYPLWGILLGAVIGVLFGHPLSRIIRSFNELAEKGTPLNLGLAISGSFAHNMLPMILIYAFLGAILGGALGFAYQHLKKDRLQQDIYHQEFEIQVATLRHHYKNLALGLQGSRTG